MMRCKSVPHLCIDKPFCDDHGAMHGETDLDHVLYRQGSPNPETVFLDMKRSHKCSTECPVREWQARVVTRYGVKALHYSLCECVDKIKCFLNWGLWPGTPTSPGLLYTFEVMIEQILYLVESKISLYSYFTHLATRPDVYGYNQVSLFHMMQSLLTHSI